MSDLNFQTIFLKSRILFWFIFTSFAGFSGALITGDLSWQTKNCMEFSATEPWIQILALLLTSGLTLAKVLNRPGPQFPHLKEENICCAELSGELAASKMSDMRFGTIR